MPKVLQRWLFVLQTMANVFNFSKSPLGALETQENGEKSAADPTLGTCWSEKVFPAPGWSQVHSNTRSTLQFSLEMEGHLRMLTPYLSSSLCIHLPVDLGSAHWSLGRREGGGL